MVIEEGIPNPASQEACLAGCTCAGHINNYGREEPEDGWFVRSNCIVHGDLLGVNVTGSDGIARQAKPPKKRLLKKLWQRTGGRVGTSTPVVPKVVVGDVTPVMPPPLVPTPMPKAEGGQNDLMEKPLEESVSVVKQFVPDDSNVSLLTDIIWGAVEADLPEMVSQELERQLPDAIAKRVEEILNQPNQER
jgi:hypothetical protein